MSDTINHQCDGGLRRNGEDLYISATSSKEHQSRIETNPIWPTARQFLKTGSTYEAPFTAKREQIKQYLESVSQSLLNIADIFKRKEQQLRNEMIETTNRKNREMLFWYILPSMIVFIWTVFSILTTRFNPKLRSSLAPRIILNALIYIVAIHVVVVFIYELVSSSNQCQPDPKLLDFSDFEFPSFNKSSRTFTNEDFLNCTATKSHIFAAPSDGIFMPTSIYDDYIKGIPAAIKTKIKRAINHLKLALHSIIIHQRDSNDFLPKVLAHMTPCEPLREFKTILEETPNWYPPLVQSLKPFDHHKPTDELCDFYIDRDFPRMQNAIVASIQQYNNLINATVFDCSSISEALQHGYKRTCLVINDQLIRIVKLVLIGISIIAIITHILANKKYENVVEKSNNPQQESQSNA